jgi:hypothetical protein
MKDETGAWLNYAAENLAVADQLRRFIVGLKNEWNNHAFAWYKHAI